MDVVCLVWATTLSQFNTRKGDTMKNVTMFCALVLVLVLGMDSVNAGEPPFEELKPEQVKSEKPKTYWQEILETRRVFGNASEGLTGKEQQNLLKLCQASREAGLINYACGSFRDEMVLRACWPGPFYSKEGRRDGQVECQMIATRAYFAHLDAANAYYKVHYKMDKKVRAEVIVAVLRALGKDYDVSNYGKAINSGTAASQSGLGDFLKYILVFEERMQVGPDARDAHYWKSIFTRLAKPGEVVNRAMGFERMGNGALLICGADGETSLKKDEFLFLRRQEEQIWQEILNPSKELQQGLQRYTYWKRDADPGEPPLVLKALQWVRQGGMLMCSWGTCTSPSVRYNLSISLQKGLCPEWRKEVDDFEKSLPTDGVSPRVIAEWHGRDSYCKSSPAEEKWWNQMEEAENNFYRQHFAKERLKWHRITASEYDEAKEGQERWLGSTNSSVFLAKQKLCSVAEWICNQPYRLGCDGAGASLESLEQGKVDRDQFLVPAEAIPGCKLRGLVAVSRAEAGNLVVLSLGTPEQP